MHESFCKTRAFRRQYNDAGVESDIHSGSLAIHRNIRLELNLRIFRTCLTTKITSHCWTIGSSAFQGGLTPYATKLGV
ncbi:hypothetical protein QFZ97_006613 [Paraburkholderia youngii]